MEEAAKTTQVFFTPELNRENTYIFLPYKSYTKIIIVYLDFLT